MNASELDLKQVVEKEIIDSMFTRSKNETSNKCITLLPNQVYLHFHIASKKIIIDTMIN